MIIFTLGVLILAIASNQAAFAMGHSRGCLDMLKRLKQLNQEFSLRSSDDMNFNKVKKEFERYLIDIHPSKLHTPNIIGHFFDQSWKKM